MKWTRSGTLTVLMAAGWMAITPGQAAGQDEKKFKKQRDLITREEIESSPKRSETIFLLIRSLRPHFLEAPRGVRRAGIDGSASAGRGQPAMGTNGSEPAALAVFVDGNRAGGVDILNSIQSEQVEEVRYYDPSKAEAEFGIGLGAGGAIVVKTFKGKPPEKPPTW